MDSCRKFLCDEKIYSPGDWRTALLNKKKELRNLGVINFEDDPIYKRIAQCKQENYFPESVCSHPATFRTNIPERAPRPEPIFKERCSRGFHRNKITGVCEPVEQRPQYKRCPTGFYRNMMTKMCEPKQREALRTNDKRCPTGYKRNKITGECEKKSDNTTRCPPGFRRNRITGTCEPNIQPFPGWHEQKRCPKGSHKNKKTGKCDPTNK